MSENIEHRLPKPLDSPTGPQDTEQQRSQILVTQHNTSSNVTGQQSGDTGAVVNQANDPAAVNVSEEAELSVNVCASNEEKRGENMYRK